MSEQADGISWTALLSVLERLKSKNRNPENQWYHGWNAAIQCLINDINSRSRSTTPVAVSEGERDIRTRLESIAEPWICVEEKPCEEAVPVHWNEMITALAAAEQRSK